MSDQAREGGMFFLYVTIDVGDVPQGDPSEYLGVDLGLKTIAADSDGDTFSGAHNANLRRRHARLSSKRQQKGTKSAKRLLRGRRLKETRFSINVNHRISKAIVCKAQDTGRGIGLEDLTHIRERITVRRSQRRAHHSWAFAQLRRFVTYKAVLQGVLLVCVDPRNTSRTCPQCGGIDKRNRPTRDRFACKSCVFSGAADITAAIEIGRRAERNAAERRTS